jgi:hypothetical protein
MKLLILTITLICGAFSKSAVDPETKLMIPTSWDDYYGELYTYPIILVAFYESKESSEMTEKILTTSSYLRNTEFLDSREIPVMVVDMSLIPKVKSFYDFETSNHLWLFVRNRAYKFETFENNIKLNDSDASITNTYDWVEKSVKGLIENVETLSHFRSRLDKYRVVTVYLGQRNENYNHFVSWVLQYSKEPLFSVFDEEVKNQIIDLYDKNRMYSLGKNRDIIAVIWHPDDLTEMDSIGMVTSDDFKDTKNLDLFYLFETRPKIRKDSSTSDNVFLMYQRQLPLFLFNYKEDSGAKHRLNEFNKAIRILPKRFVYDVFEHESRRAIDYQHIMIQSNNYNLIEPNSIYIVWLSHGTRPQIMKFDKEFTTEEIVSWTFNFSKMFPHIFGNNKGTQEKETNQENEKFEEEDL